MLPQLRSLALPLFAGAALAAAPAVSAQVIVDDFEDGEFDAGAFVFSGGENGVLTLTSDTPDGSNFAAQFDADIDDAGGFTGFGQAIDGGPLDITDVEDGFLVFDASARGTFTLEINLQNTGGAENGEIRNALRFVDGDGEYRRYRLSLNSFFSTREATFELNDVAQYAWTILDATGDGSGDTQETQLRLDNVQVVEGVGFETDIVALDFDDGDFSDTNGFFYYAGGEGITAAATSDTGDGSDNAFSGQIDGDEYGGFAGFGFELMNAPVDVTGAESLNFLLRANGSATLEINLQTPDNQNEVREAIRITDTDGDYRNFSIPLSAFIQSSANLADLSALSNIALTFVNVTGDGDPNTTEFAFDIDAIGFGVQNTRVAIDDVPRSLAAAAVAVPNPTTGAASVVFELTEASHVRADVLDVLGRRVATLADGPTAVGPVRLAVPVLAPGSYIVRVQTPDGISATRLTVVR